MHIIAQELPHETEKKKKRRKQGETGKQKAAEKYKEKEKSIYTSRQITHPFRTVTT